MTPYPLAWPESIPRWKGPRDAGQFRTSLSGAIDNVRSSLLRFAADSEKPLRNVVVSSNVTLGAHRPDDPGVAVWFEWDGLSACIPVDRYAKVEANLQAIHHIIEARRTELRHGTLALVRASFTGLAALPAPAGKRHWRDVMGFAPDVSVSMATQIEAAYCNLARRRHPDAPGGSHEAMAELTAAKADALREIGGGQ